MRRGMLGLSYDGHSATIGSGGFMSFLSQIWGLFVFLYSAIWSISTGCRVTLIEIWSACAQVRHCSAALARKQSEARYESHFQRHSPTALQLYSIGTRQNRAVVQKAQIWRVEALIIFPIRLALR